MLNIDGTPIPLGDGLTHQTLKKRDDPRSVTYYCTHRVDTGKRLPKCEGEVDHSSTVPSLVNYQSLISQPLSIIDR